MKIAKINFKKGKEFIFEIPRRMSERVFLAFLCFVGLAFIISGIVFYKYKATLVAPVESGEEQLKFDQKNYQRVLNEWQKRNERFKNAASKQYLDPFAH